MTENEIAYIIRGGILEVYNTLGAGLLEWVYVQALEYELRGKVVFVEREVLLPVLYKNIKMDLGYWLNLLVNNRII